MGKSPDLISTLISQLASAPSNAFCVAFSGGLDSHVLLHAMQSIAFQKGWSLRALHIHHGLSAHADEWQRHCQSVCSALNVPYENRSVRVNCEGGKSLEAAARTARYQIFEEQLQTHECLLLAHHQDDQAETLLLQALRGAGPKGLAAMPNQNDFAQGWLYRPFLTCTRTQIENYAKLHQLNWIEDDSNANERFDRNFLRHRVMPVINERWNSASRVLSRSARHCGHASELIDELAEIDLQATLNDSNNSLFINLLKNLSPARLENVLRYWFSQQSILMPCSAKLFELCQQLRAYQSSHQLLVKWSDVEVRAHQGQLFVMPALIQKTPLEAFIWHGEPIDLPAPLGLLTFEALALPSEVSLPLSISWREPGQKVQLRGRTHRHSLKKLLHALGVPPWLRDRTPLIFHEKILVAVPGYTL